MDLYIVLPGWGVIRGIDDVVIDLIIPYYHWLSRFIAGEVFIENGIILYETILLEKSLFKLHEFSILFESFEVDYLLMLELVSLHFFLGGIKFDFLIVSNSKRIFRLLVTRIIIYCHLELRVLHWLSLVVILSSFELRSFLLPIRRSLLSGFSSIHYLYELA